MTDLDQRKPGRPKGSRDKNPRPGRKLTAPEVLHIRRMYSDGLDFSDIRMHYPQVSRQNIEHIVRRKTWKNLPAEEGVVEETKKTASL